MTVYRTCHNFQYMHEFVLQCCFRELTATMTHRSTVIGLLMATVSSIAAKPLATNLPLSPRNDVNTFCYFSGHWPTEETYLQGVSQYCDKYVQNGVSLGNRNDLVSTITLKDTYGCPIDWVYKMWWEDNTSVGPVDISHDMCINKFHDFVDDSTCPDGLVKFMVSGRYSIEFENKLGSKLWIETRQRADDKFPTICKHD
jgi:hypothetical protein